MPKEIKIGNKWLGENHPVFVIAELGYNFNTLGEAIDSVDAASEAGVDALKIQTFRADTLTVKNVNFPQEAGGTNQYEEFKRYEISEEAHRIIFRRALEKRLIPFSTPSHEEDVELLERLDAPLYKIGSDDLTNLPLLRVVARKGKPMILSTGMATFEEVQEAVRVIHESGNSDLILLQCVSNYPVRDLSAVNLRVMETYRKSFDILVGLSDHTTTITAAIAAVAIGAKVIEKHFALSKKMDVPDAFFSADPPEMKELVRSIKEVELMLGDGVKRPAPSERVMRQETRKSIVAKRRIREGETIRPEHLMIKRPAYGISPRDWNLVIERKAKREIQQDEFITWDIV